MDDPGAGSAHPPVSGRRSVSGRRPVRAAVGGDAAQIRDLAVENAMFTTDDLDGFDDLLAGYLDGSLEGHRWIVAEGTAGAIAGAAYYAPEPFADRVWNLYFLAVDPHIHRAGVGHALVEQVERALCEAGQNVARVLIVETSSTDLYEPARRFYAREGFDREALIREFYGPGDDKIVFWKRLAEGLS